MGLLADGSSPVLKADPAPSSDVESGRAEAKQTPPAGATFHLNLHLLVTSCAWKFVDLSSPYSPSCPRFFPLLGRCRALFSSAQLVVRFLAHDLAAPSAAHGAPSIISFHSEPLHSPWDVSLSHL